VSPVKHGVKEQSKLCHLVSLVNDGLNGELKVAAQCVTGKTRRK